MTSVLGLADKRNQFGLAHDHHSDLVGLTSGLLDSLTDGNAAVAMPSMGAAEVAMLENRTERAREGETRREQERGRVDEREREEKRREGEREKENGVMRRREGEREIRLGGSGWVKYPQKINSYTRDLNRPARFGQNSTRISQKLF